MSYFYAETASTLRLITFSYVLNMFAIAPWNIFMMAALKSFSDNPLLS